MATILKYKSHTISVMASILSHNAVDCGFDPWWGPKTRGSQEPVIAHLVFNLTSQVNRKWGCYT